MVLGGIAWCSSKCKCSSGEMGGNTAKDVNERGDGMSGRNVVGMHWGCGRGNV